MPYFHNWFCPSKQKAVLFSHTFCGAGKVQVETWDDSFQAKLAMSFSPLFCWGLQHFQPQPADRSHLWPGQDPWHKRSLKVDFATLFVEKMWPCQSLFLYACSCVCNFLVMCSLLDCFIVIVIPLEKSLRPRQLWILECIPQQIRHSKKGTSMRPPTVTIPKNGDIPRKDMTGKTWCPRFLPSFWIDEPSSTVV